MQIIISHINIDFDGLASMVAAGKLYPRAKLVLPDKASVAVQRFLALYRDSLKLYSPNQIDWDKVEQVVLVDTANMERIGSVKEHLLWEQLEEVVVYDHHQPSPGDVKATRERVEQVGATVTMLVEELRQQQVDISAFEATIMALGLYTDTGSFSYLGTTGRDLQVGAYLLDQGANLAIVSRFSERPLLGDQQELFNSLLANAKEYNYRGLDILLTWHEQKSYQGTLALLARKLIEVTGVHGLFIVVEMAGKVYLVARSNSDLLDVHAVVVQFGGGGHPKAASATVKGGNCQEIMATIESQLPRLVGASVTAKDIMSSPVKTVTPEVTIKEAAKVLLRYGHTGLPVVIGEELVGIISRRDVDKANHHGLGHAPVKGYMSKNVLTIQPDSALEEIQNLLIEHNVGRLPVMVEGKLAGIVSRSDVLNYLHGENIKAGFQDNILPDPVEKDVSLLLQQGLDAEIAQLLLEVAAMADRLYYTVFLVGGFVRDLLLEKPNHDIDLMVEGDGILFARTLALELGGKVTSHDKFGTATWVVKPHLKLDITTARREYYDYPAALPTVERGNLREDLFRRDFTVNAMAVQLNGGKEGCLIDYFHGGRDLATKTIRILYNLSFVEDPTRILRAVRFEQRLGFKMDSRTQELALSAADLIASVGETRIATELKLLFREEHPVEAIEDLRFLGIWDYLLGDQAVDQETLERVKRLDQLLLKIGLARNEGSVWFCYLAALYYDKQDWQEKLEGYALNKGDFQLLEELDKLENLAHLGEITPNSQLGELHDLLKGYTQESILLQAIMASNQVTDHLVTYLEARQKLALPLNGADLQQLGIAPGPVYSQILGRLEQEVLNGSIRDSNQAITWIKTNFNKLPE